MRRKGRYLGSNEFISYNDEMYMTKSIKLFPTHLLVSGVPDVWRCMMRRSGEPFEFTRTAVWRFFSLEACVPLVVLVIASDSAHTSCSRSRISLFDLSLKSGLFACGSCWAQDVCAQICCSCSRTSLFDRNLKSG